MTIMPMIVQAAEQLEMLQRMAAVPLMAMRAAERCQMQLTPVIQLMEERKRMEEDVKRLSEGPIRQALNFIAASAIDFSVFKEPELKLSARAGINHWDDDVECDNDEEPQPPRRPIGFRFPPNY
jgi:hypothetical protein